MAFISEMDYVGGGEDFPSREFLEITLRPGEDPADFTVSFYNADGTLTQADMSGNTTSSFFSTPEFTLQDILDTIQGVPPGTGVLQEGSIPSPSPTIAGRELQVVEHPDEPGGYIFIIPSNLSDASGVNNTVDNAEAVALTNTDTGVVVDAYDMGPNVTVATFTEGAAAGTTPTQTIASHPDGSVQVDAGGNVTTSSAPTGGSSVLCFTADTRLMTPRGPRRAADIAIGDLVCTRDVGVQPVVWIKSQTVTRAELRANPKLRPVRITAGALGNGQPSRDLLVSRQHRMMLSSPLIEQICGHREVLVPAIKLTALAGVHVDKTVARVSYIHIMFDRHQIVFAEGAPSESFLPGREGLMTLSAGQLRQFRLRFPAQAAPGARAKPARPIVDGAEAKRLVAALAESGTPVSGGYDFAPDQIKSGGGYR